MFEEACLDIPMVLQVNGKERRVRAPANAFLLEVLRDELALTGAKLGCGMGECGACVVLLDGEAVCSCLTLAVEAQGHACTGYSKIVEAVMRVVVTPEESSRHAL
jgi:aerobic-type carbon monoxide dehydrogenase small subunit (CoxS/CutS family)